MKNCAVVPNFNAIRGEISEEKNLYFLCGPEEKNFCGRAGELAVRQRRTANCDASVRCSVPLFLRQAERASSRPTNGAAYGRARGISRIGCSIPRCSAKPGGGRPADAAKEVFFPVVRRYHAVCASLRSACRPRQRAAKGDAASVRCSSPLSILGDLQSARRGFQAVGYDVLENERLMTTDGKESKERLEIHRSVSICLVKCMKIINPIRKIFWNYIFLPMNSVRINEAAIGVRVKGFISKDFLAGKRIVFKYFCET